ncbi:hypothetical protein [Streptomyces sp. NPDC096153]|uniref:hypothetical protein n=1 Tax=Streptomyces sp. NPDC096153 TaxID=3155548 RepID=UPI0033319BF8
MTEPTTPEQACHACPPGGSGLTPCCGRTPLELPHTDLMTRDSALVTCHGAEADARPPDAEDEPPDLGPQELTAEEARALADDLGLDLLRAEDTIALVREMCTLREKQQRASVGQGEVRTGEVLAWLKGSQCGRQLLAAAHSCDNCEGVDPDSCMANPQRSRTSRVDQAVRRVQTWMALDLHMALGRPVDHGVNVEHQGFRSWADWWAELLADVRTGTSHWPQAAKENGALRTEAEKQRDQAREELAGARATIDHMSKAMSWIGGHDRQGLDHLEEAQAEARARESAVRQARRWAGRARAAESELLRLRGEVHHQVQAKIDVGGQWGNALADKAEFVQKVRRFANQLEDADRDDLLELIGQPLAPAGSFADAREAVRKARGDEAAPQTPVLFAAPDPQEQQAVDASAGPVVQLVHQPCGQLVDIPGDATLHPDLPWPGHDCPADHKETGRA